MADDETQGSDDTGWEAPDASPDPLLPSMGFDEPLVWPESPVWDDIAGPLIAQPVAGDDTDLFFQWAPEMPAVPPLSVEGGSESHAAPPPDLDARWRPAAHPVTEAQVDPDATVLVGPLAALGGGSGPVPSEFGGNVPWPAGGQGPSRPPLPVDGSPDGETPLGSIWSNERIADPDTLVGLGGVAAPVIYADNPRNTAGSRWRRIDVRPGNAAVIGLISVVSLVLLGMFLSVRARNDVPTDASQPRSVADDITATGPLNTTPQSTSTTTTTTTPPAINLSELVQATEATVAPSTATGSGAAAATTTPTTRSATPTSTASATTTPTTQPTVTSEDPPATTEVTSPPVTATTPTTSRPTPTFTIPTFTIPSIPGTPSTLDFGRFGGLLNKDG